MFAAAAPCWSDDDAKLTALPSLKDVTKRVKVLLLGCNSALSSQKITFAAVLPHLLAGGWRVFSLGSSFFCCTQWWRCLDKCHCVTFKHAMRNVSSRRC